MSSRACGRSSGGVARVTAWIPDLLFGSRVQADLTAAGHIVALIGDADVAFDALDGADVLVVDLTVDPEKGAGLVESLRERGLPARVCTLGFYSHVDVQARQIAERAGFDLIVPRSRMAREGASLLARLLDEA